ncbi:large-conductance mechanosensitive channel [Cladochytrium replicatum]|nr:large-conductance mechanosensitive channel [Cladochytrium replicatum]
MAGDAPKGYGKVLDGGKKVANVGSSLAKDFAAFISRGSVVDLAVGIIIGGAFTGIVNGFVEDLISPLIALATPGTNLNQQFKILRCPPKKLLDCQSNVPGNWTTAAIAVTDGAVVLGYGHFIQTIINFIIIALILFFIIKAYSAAFVRPKPVETKDCPYCFSAISLKATRCSACTSHIPDDAETGVVEEDADAITKH